MADYITISYNKVTKPTDVIDKWNYWVFVIDVDVDLEGEESQSELDLDGSFSADRVTPELKVSLDISSDYEREKYELDEGWYTSVSRSKHFSGLIVKSLGNHWSLGMFGSAYSSSYSNTKWSVDLAPAIEYNIFPYSEYTRREFRFLYRAAFKKIQYEEETIYEKTRESLLYQSLSATFELKERWGSLRSTLEGSHYFHDVSKNNLELYSDLNLRLCEGFSFDIYGYISMIRDQLSLPKEGATKEELLLHQKQIATDYDYYISIGFRYTFGSIYSNFVNPRF